MSVNIETLTGHLEHIKNYIGLKGFALEFYELIDSKGFAVSFTQRYDIDRAIATGDHSAIINTLQEIVDAVKNSDLVKEVRGEYRDKIVDQKNKIFQLEKKVKDLEKYKNHYELEFKLRHGGKNESE